MLCGVCSFNLTVCESAHTLKTLLPDEIQELGVIIVGFTGESNHECGTKMDSRDLLTYSGQELTGLLSGYIAAHPFENGITDVLQCNIHILAHVFTLTHYREQVKREVIGIAVVQTQPLYTGDV